MSNRTSLTRDDNHQTHDTTRSPSQAMQLAPFQDARGEATTQLALNALADRSPRVQQHMALAGAMNGAASPSLQAKFNGVPPNPNNPVAAHYSGHDVSIGGTRSNTDCGEDNEIITAGEEFNQSDSKPGTPTDWRQYTKTKSVNPSFFDLPGGLVRDKNVDESSTKMHLINHHLENSTTTQNNSENIMVGTKKSNSFHETQVESEVKGALANSPKAGLNDEYQTEIKQAEELTDGDLGGVVTWWDKGKEPTESLDTTLLTDGYRSAGGSGDVVTRNPTSTSGSASATKKSKTGPTTAASVPNGKFVKPSTQVMPQHLWLTYRVKANYGSAPAFVTDNVTHERNKNNSAATPRLAVATRIADFETDWKDDAFPASFDCNASYYTASWIPDTPYHQSDETPHNMPTDL